MNTPTPADSRFEDRLLAAILDDFQQLTVSDADAPTRLSRRSHGGHAAPPRRVVPVLVAGAAAAALVVTGVTTLGSHGQASPRHALSGPQVGIGGHAGGTPTAGQSVLYRLASASAAVAPTQGRYVVLSETDTETAYTGESKRTSVIDTLTGASTTYQQADSAGGQAPSLTYTSEPPVLTEGPDPTSTEVWYSALPTDPTALRTKLLAVAKQQAAQTAAEIQAQAAKAGKTIPSSIDEQPALSDDDYVYQEADTLLWSPLVQPTLRSALYTVLAGTSGLTVASDATDPAGRPAIAMTRHYNGVSETDTTYEDPGSGAVLAQVWASGSDVITAVYQPISSSSAIPPNPYAG